MIFLYTDSHGKVYFLHGKALCLVSDGDHFQCMSSFTLHKYYFVEWKVSELFLN